MNTQLVLLLFLIIVLVSLNIKKPTQKNTEHKSNNDETFFPENLSNQKYVLLVDQNDD